MNLICPNCSGDVTSRQKKCSKCGECLDDECVNEYTKKHRNGRVCPYKHHNEEETYK